MRSHSHENDFYSHANMTHFHKKDLQLASFWKWKVFGTLNGHLHYPVDSTIHLINNYPRVTVSTTSNLVSFTLFIPEKFENEVFAPKEGSKVFGGHQCFRIFFNNFTFQANQDKFWCLGPILLNGRAHPHYLNPRSHCDSCPFDVGVLKKFCSHYATYPAFTVLTL